MSQYKRVVLVRGKEQSLKRFHPWVFSGAVAEVDEGVVEGDVVEVYTTRQKYLGTGHYLGGSIAVRIFSFQKVEVNANFWKEKVSQAYLLRQQMGLVDNPDTNVYRLIYAEGDGMPGLIVDYYNGVAVFQAHTIGMYLIREEICAALVECYGDKLKAIYSKSSKTLPPSEVVEPEDGYLFGSSEGNHEVMENSCKFLIDWQTGQKTGFFVDQRENRNMIARFAKGKSVLNTFCYSGGFSVSALKAGAKLVHSVDLSEKAIELANQNVALNTPFEGTHEAFATDTLEFLKKSDQQYDIIILDPPAYAKHKRARHKAVIGYKNINELALRRIKPGGILFTYSCTQVVDRNLFFNTIISAAIEARREVKILARTGHPVDHPISIFHPEGEYLKGLVVQVL